MKKWLTAFCTCLTLSDVKVIFVVDEEGKVGDISIAKSREYSLDNESIKMIQTSGKWVPGTKNGIAVKTYKMQPINFRLE